MTCERPSARRFRSARLERAGCRLAPVDLSEFAKAEGAVTCCSLILEGEGARAS